MNDGFDSFVADLQATIDNETLSTYGRAFMDRLKDLKHAGGVESPSTEASLTGSCGDLMRIRLEIGGETIRKAGFETTGCGPSQVCGSVACELAEGKSLEQAASIDGSDILEVLGGLPAENEHCAYLAAETLREAVRRYWASGEQNAEA